MSFSKYANRIDANQQSIINDLEKLGFVILLNHDDFIAVYQGRMLLVECKNPKTTLNKDGSIKKGAVKDSQIKLLKIKRDNEYNFPYILAWYTEDILAWFGIKKHDKIFKDTDLILKEVGII